MTIETPTQTTKKLYRIRYSGKSAFNHEYRRQVIWFGTTGREALDDFTRRNPHILTARLDTNENDV